MTPLRSPAPVPSPRRALAVSVVPARVVIGGIGVSPALHLTPELVARVLDCARVFVAAVTREQLGQAAARHSDFNDVVLDRSRTEFLHEIYDANVAPADNYTRAVERIVAAADGGIPVAFLTPGHPLYWDSVSRGLIERLAPERVEVVAGVSSLDTIVADTRAEVEPYFAVVDASFAVSCDLALDPRASYLFVQPHRVRHETVVNNDEELRASSRAFQLYLLQHLPREQRLLVRRSASIWEAAATARSVSLADLHEIAPAAWVGCSVLVERRDSSG